MRRQRAWPKRKLAAAALAAGLTQLAAGQPAGAQVRPPTAPAADAAREQPAVASGAAASLKGREVAEVEVRGNRQVSTAVIRNLIRTRPGEPFDPATVAEDYQRVYTLRKFSNVEAKVFESAPGGGVTVVFIVTEQDLVNSIRFKGNARVDTAELRGVVDVRVGEAIDPFRNSLARAAIENLYKDKNFPLARVEVDAKALAETNDVVFNIVEGPNTRIRNIDFKGAKSFSKDKLRDQVKSASYFVLFSPGRYSPQQVEEDVASLRRFYESKGFFDVRVGRKLVWSPDLSELQIDFLVEEGPRYVIDKVTFVGNNGVPEQQLRARMKLLEGRPYDGETLQRDTREIVREYSGRFGYIYQPQSNDPDYLRIDSKQVFRNQPGKLELIYTIREGREFQVGNIYVKGNTRSQDKLVLREFRDFAPGQRFNSGELQDAQERLRRSPYFGSVVVTPIGEEPGVRDLLVEVTEQHTASFNIGAGVNSNGGVGGNITYEQRNFDIGNFPATAGDIFSDRAFIGAGQVLRVSAEPGTTQSNASIRFSEPWVFDQPFGFSNELFFRDRIREDYEDSRFGDIVTVSHRFDYVHSAAVTLRGERVEIHDIDDRRERAQDILDAEGKNTLTSVALNLRRDTTNPGIFPDRGSVTTARAEFYGALGGAYSFQKYTVGWDAYQTVYEDLLDRKTVVGLHANVGYISGESIFFERFYGGGIGSVRGFQFRGISPRQGRDDDAIGGDFSMTGTAEVNFPLVGESLRGVVFTDAGTVRDDFALSDIRVSVGVGARVILPFLGQTPLAIDFGVPLIRNDEDETQVISFSFGFTQ